MPRLRYAAPPLRQPLFTPTLLFSLSLPILLHITPLRHHMPFSWPRHCFIQPFHHRCTHYAISINSITAAIITQPLRHAGHYATLSLPISLPLPFATVITAPIRHYRRCHLFRHYHYRHYHYAENNAHFASIRRELRWALHIAALYDIAILLHVCHWLFYCHYYYATLRLMIYAIITPLFLSFWHYYYLYFHTHYYIIDIIIITWC